MSGGALNSTHSCRASRDVTWRVMSYVLRRACSNMADDEEAVALVDTSLSR